MAFTAGQALRLLRREIVAVLGCTEPAAIAFAVTAARRYLRPRPGSPLDVELWLSREVRRNGGTAVVPVVNRRGVNYAAAVGLVTRARGFNPFAGFAPQQVRDIVRQRGWLAVHPAAQCGVYARARVSDGKRWAEATIQGRHDELTLLADSRGRHRRCTRRRLAVPPELGYGAAGRPPVPPNAWLIFEIELLAVK